MSKIQYLYISDTAESEPPIQNGEGIMVIDAEGAYYITALISNELFNSDIYAPEINWYLKHTKEDKDEKKEIFKKLYKIRDIRHKYTSYKKHSLSVDRSVAIIGDDESSLDFVEYAKNFFDVEFINSSKLLNLEGKFGAFKIRFEYLSEEEEEANEPKIIEKELTFSQIIYTNEENYFTKYLGVETLFDNDIDVLIKKVRNRIGFFEYDESIKFNPSLCLYQHKDEPTCTNCLSVCPTFGLLNNSEKKEISFSHLDCIDCGACVSACPTGVIDFAYFTQETFLEVAKLCKDKKIFIVSEKDLKEIEGVLIPKDFVPFVVETDKFLTKTHFQILLEEGKSSLVFYTPLVNEFTKKAINEINELYLKDFNKKAIYIATNKNELQAQMEDF